jgi:hypothetical protein
MVIYGDLFFTLRKGKCNYVPAFTEQLEFSFYVNSRLQSYFFIYKMVCLPLSAHIDVVQVVRERR